MELKYILCVKTHRESDAGEVWQFKFQPTLEEYKKKCTFEVMTRDPYDTMGALGLPQGIGDVIIMDFKPKNVQEKLKPGDKKAVE